MRTSYRAGAARMGRVFCALIALAWTSVPPASGQTASETTLKAAFIYNFVKFTEWPADVLPASGRLVVCIVGDDSISAALTQVAKGQAIDGHELTIHPLANDAPAKSCHVLYVSGLVGKRVTQILDRIKEAPVLTVSDAAGFAQSGGVAELFVESGKMRFAINVETVHRSQLRLSSRLLSVAKIVRDDHAQ